MSNTLRAELVASHREELASIRPRPARVTLDPQASASSIREVAADAIRTVHGKQETAANEMGIHFASLSRQLKDGSLRIEQIEKLGPEFAAAFGKELVERFGPLTDPAAEAERLCNEIQAMVNVLRQFVRSAA